MNIVNAENRDKILIDKLFKVWKKSVKATHMFLTDDEIEKIAEYVPNALNGVAHLIIATNNDEPIAFMGIEEQKLEMLFVSPDEQGRGVGKELLQYGIEKYNVNELGVNEQNPQAIGFYEHMGFHVYKRSDTDEQGNPYLILYMRLS
ncbi:GNAT family N-acetyltransferase [Clostridium sp. Marseille-P2415]|uniref:GNAT family N-acetyltransferase n=1 Tax=Clostridium sp. Marseille-P2415 TaxID=1805471 RepID=UPI0009883E75|nr:GNAT family N-acetyltransferase [Clostridium sp. Marseille-P2415]